MKNKNKQSGSAFVVTVILLSLAIAGTIGYIVWYNFSHTKSTDLINSDNQSSKIDTVKTQSNNNTSSSDSEIAETGDDNVDESSGSYFAIDFWNIKGIYGGGHYISYSISSNNILTIDSKELSASCTEGVARIKRFAADDYTHGYPASAISDDYSDKKASEVFAKDSYNSEGGNRKVGGYYYVLSTPLQVL